MEYLNSALYLAVLLLLFQFSGNIFDTFQYTLKRQLSTVPYLQPPFSDPESEYILIQYG
jgi:hypothetical protein